MKRLIDAVELTKTLEEILAEPDHDKMFLIGIQRALSEVRVSDTIETRVEEPKTMTLDEAHTRAVHNDRLFKVKYDLMGVTYRIAGLWYADHILQFVCEHPRMNVKVLNENQYEIIVEALD